MFFSVPLSSLAVFQLSVGYFRDLIIVPTSEENGIFRLGVFLFCQFSAFEVVFNNFFIAHWRYRLPEIKFKKDI